MKSQTEQFPLTVQRGSAVVRIYRESKPSGYYFRVCFYVGGKRCGRNFPDLATAKAEAKAKAAQLSRGDLEAIQVTGKDRVVYGRALEALRPLGIELDTAALEYADARKALGEFSLADAAQFYMRHHGHRISRKSVADAVGEMIAGKTERGVSEAYIADLRYRLGAFAEAFHCTVDDVVTDDLRAFLDGLRLGPRGFNNTLASLKTFFSFAKDRGWISREADPLSGIEKRKGKVSPVEIFTPKEMAELLEHSSNDLRPCLALAAFAGLRSEEILRLDWSDVDRRPGFVEVAADKAKTATRRLVPLAANLVKWLAACPRRTERVWQFSKPYYFESVRDTVRRLNKARKAKTSRFQWKANALRHSFISYRLAELQDVNRVALEAGNSPKVIFQHYRELCTPADARTWFSLVPNEAENVIPLEAEK